MITSHKHLREDFKKNLSLVETKNKETIKVFKEALQKFMTDIVGVFEPLN